MTTQAPFSGILLGILLVALTLPAYAGSSGDKELDRAVKAVELHDFAQRCRELADTKPKLALRAIPIAYHNIESLPESKIYGRDRYLAFSHAVASLLRIKKAKALDTVFPQFKKSKLEYARILLLQLALQHPEVEVLEIAALGLKDKSPRVVSLGARILGNSKDARMLTPLVIAMLKWENREHIEKITFGRKKVTAEIGGRAWVACRDALHRLTGQSLHTGLDYQSYIRVNRGSIDPTKVDLEKPTKVKQTTGIGLFGLEITGRNIIFILDISGSMEQSDPFTPEQLEKLSRGRTGVAGKKDTLLEEMRLERKRIRRAKKELLSVISSLHEEKRFNILLYSNEVTSWKNMPIDASQKAKESAKKFIEEVKPHGVTYTDEAVRRAMDDPSVDTIYLITDGAPTHVGGSSKNLPPDARRLMDEIIRTTKASNYMRAIRLFTLGFKDAEEPFLKRLARGNNGSYTRIR